MVLKLTKFHSIHFALYKSWLERRLFPSRIPRSHFCACCDWLSGSCFAECCRGRKFGICIVSPQPFQLIPPWLHTYQSGIIKSYWVSCSTHISSEKRGITALRNHIPTVIYWSWPYYQIEWLLSTQYDIRTGKYWYLQEREVRQSSLWIFYCRATKS